ncbi:MAG: DNA recombination protein RmuC, partial [Pseudomonadota bacterium]|nr:DNA recombination protein RmuC [Pseudomonadota bacterium]
MSWFEWAALTLLVAIFVVQLGALLRRPGVELATNLGQLRQDQLRHHAELGERIERIERELRHQVQTTAQATRQELSASLAQFQQTLTAQAGASATLQ